MQANLEQLSRSPTHFAKYAHSASLRAGYMNGAPTCCGIADMWATHPPSCRGNAVCMGRPVHRQNSDRIWSRPERLELPTSGLDSGALNDSSRSPQKARIAVPLSYGRKI